MTPAIAKTLYGLLARLPASWLEGLSRPLGAALSMGGRRQQVTLANLQACFPQLPEQDIRQLARDSNREFARTVLETAWIWSWPFERLVDAVEEVHGLELVREAQAQGRGIIFAAPHFGAWELLGLYMQTVADMAILFKSPKQAGFEELLVSKRARGGASVITADGQGLRKLLRHLKAGGAVGMLPDQQPKDGEGEFAPFFGVPAMTGTLLPKMARRAGAVVIFAVCERLPGPHRWRVHLLPADTGIDSEETATSLAALNRGVEQCVMINRPQWLWAYKRFRMRPPGLPSLYD